MFLGLGVLIYLYAERHGISLATQNGKFVNTDGLYPLLTLNYFGKIGAIAFLIGVIASTFASIDSCIAALTTAFSYDFMDIENQPHEIRKKLKNRVLFGVNIVMFLNRNVFLEQSREQSSILFSKLQVILMDPFWVCT